MALACFYSHSTLGLLLMKLGGITGASCSASCGRGPGVRKNLFFRHRISLAETDAITSRPAIDCRFRARCDECGKEYFYKASDVLRFEQEPPEAFTPHPLFRDEGSGANPVVAEGPGQKIEGAWVQGF